MHLSTGVELDGLKRSLALQEDTIELLLEQGYGDPVVSHEYDGAHYDFRRGKQERVVLISRALPDYSSLVIHTYAVTDEPTFWLVKELWGDEGLEISFLESERHDREGVLAIAKTIGRILRHNGFRNQDVEVKTIGVFQSDVAVVVVDTFEGRNTIIVEIAGVVTDWVLQQIKRQLGVTDTGV